MLSCRDWIVMITLPCTLMMSSYSSFNLSGAFTSDSRQFSINSFRIAAVVSERFQFIWYRCCLVEGWQALFIISRVVLSDFKFHSSWPRIFWNVAIWRLSSQKVSIITSQVKKTNLCEGGVSVFLRSLDSIQFRFNPGHFRSVFGNFWHLLLYDIWISYLSSCDLSTLWSVKYFAFSLRLCKLSTSKVWFRFKIYKKTTNSGKYLTAALTANIVCESIAM